ncbi:MAG: DUF4375 domain-containing protein [Nitrospira sp.]|nr:DUF4375 domain-containing protein [Nitrospira sp.]
MPDDFLEGYNGQSTEDLLALEGQYRIDSLVLAFEQALQQKTSRSHEEQFVLAIEALEREVNNGGYSQFFTNSSNEYVGIIVQALHAIDCPKTAAITNDALAGLNLHGPVSPASAEATALSDDHNVEQALAACDDRYFSDDEPIADRLVAWIKNNAARIRVGAA